MIKTLEHFCSISCYQRIPPNNQNLQFYNISIDQCNPKFTPLSRHLYALPRHLHALPRHLHACQGTYRLAKAFTLLPRHLEARQNISTIAKSRHVFTNKLVIVLMLIVVARLELVSIFEFKSKEICVKLLQCIHMLTCILGRCLNI